jgi:hypothetical protein
MSRQSRNKENEPQEGKTKLGISRKSKRRMKKLVPNLASSRLGARIYDSTAFNSCERAVPWRGYLGVLFMRTETAGSWKKFWQT